MSHEIESIDINAENLNNDKFLTVIANILQALNELLVKDDVEITDLTKILTQTVDAKSFYEQVKTSTLDNNITQSNQILTSLETTINTTIESIQNQYTLDLLTLKESLGNTFSDLENFKGEQGLKGEQGIKGDMGEQGLKGDKGEAGAVTFESLSIEQKESLKGDKGEQGLKGDNGQDGTFENLTDEQKESLKGEQGVQGLKGDNGQDGTFENLTDEQKLSLKGEQGVQGLKGDKGDDGVVTFESLSIEQKESLKGDIGQQGLKGDKGDDGVIPSGGVLQVVSHLTAIQGVQTVTTEDTIVNDLSKTIIPKGNNSKFLIFIRWVGEIDYSWDVCFNIHLDGSRININDGSRSYFLSMASTTYEHSNNSSTPEILNFSTLFHSSSSVGVPLKFDLVVDSNANRTLWNNRCFGSATSSGYENGTSEIIIMEIGE